MELCIQLAIIMVGKQAMNTCLEMVWPMLFKWLNTLRVKAGLGPQPSRSQAYRAQWAKDYQLVAWGSEALFAEYLEMGTYNNCPPFSSLFRQLVRVPFFQIADFYH